MKRRVLLAISGGLTAFLVACTPNNSSDKREPTKAIHEPKEIKVQRTERPDLKAIPKHRKKRQTEKADLSPMGFDWRHYKLAQFTSQSIYEHGLKGIIREQRFRERKQILMIYILSLRQVEKSDFESWDSKHQLSFLINTLHSHLFDLALKKNFSNLGQKPLNGKFIKIFAHTYSYDEFVFGEIITRFPSKDLVLSLFCFEDFCPELRNRIYNYLNVDSLIETSALRFLMDPDKNIFDVKKRRVKLSPVFQKYKKLFPEDVLRSYISQRLQKTKPEWANLVKDPHVKIQFR